MLFFCLQSRHLAEANPPWEIWPSIITTEALADCSTPRASRPFMAFIVPPSYYHFSHDSLCSLRVGTLVTSLSGQQSTLYSDLHNKYLLTGWNEELVAQSFLFIRSRLLPSKNLIPLDFIIKTPVLWRAREPWCHLIQEQPTREMVSVGLATHATSNSKRSFSMVFSMLSYLMSAGKSKQDCTQRYCKGTGWAASRLQQKRKG